ncbi:MAG TPA: hypothetical protein PLR81_08010 [Treponemataceae bacterium]|nr:hypothetical protein [Treponemataceae bacterium]
MNEIIELIKASGVIIGLIIGGIILIGILKKGVLKSITAGKDGLSLQLSDELENRSAAEYFVNRRIEEIDRLTHSELLQSVRDLRKPIMRAVKKIGACTVGVRAFIADIRSPIYRSVDKNDLKNVLANSNLQSFHEKKIIEIKNEFEEIIESFRDELCGADKPENAWEMIEQDMKDILKSWTDSTRLYLIQCSQKKISVYNENIAMRKKEDAYRKILEHCKEKNEAYIRELK